MKFRFSPYTIAERQGALIQVQFPDGSIGYADCHPWESLGDLPLSEQCALLEKGQTTALTSRSLYFARLDAEARARGVNLFEGLQVPDSHFLLLDLAKPRMLPPGYNRVKIKLGKDLAKETPLLKAFLSILPEQCQVRLDFNGRLTRESFEQILHVFENEQHKIEFYEDPFPYEAAAWAEVQQKHGITLACDFGSERGVGNAESATYLVVKPAVQDANFIRGSQKIVVTSYLDHPLGQMAAAYVAGQLKKQFPTQIETCGLLSHLVYEPNVFSSMLPKGPDFVAITGTGFGFDELLKNEFM